MWVFVFVLFLLRALAQIRLPCVSFSCIVWAGHLQTVLLLSFGFFGVFFFFKLIT